LQVGCFIFPNKVGLDKGEGEGRDGGMLNKKVIYENYYLDLSIKTLLMKNIVIFIFLIIGIKSFGQSDFRLTKFVTNKLVNNLPIPIQSNYFINPKFGFKPYLDTINFFKNYVIDEIQCDSTYSYSIKNLDSILNPIFIKSNCRTNYFDSSNNSILINTYLDSNFAQNDFRYLLKFNTTNELIEETQERFFNAKWIKSRKSVILRSTLLDIKIDSEGNSSLDKWVFTGKNYSFKDNRNNLIKTTKTLVLFNNGIDDSICFSYSYYFNLLNKRIKDVDSSCNTIDITKYYYNNLNQLITFSKFNNGIDSVNSINFYYNDKGLIDSIITIQLISPNTFSKTNKRQYYFNNFNLLTKSENYIWNNSISNWEFDKDYAYTEYFYDDYSNSNLDSNLKTIVYPNPTNNIIYLKNVNGINKIQLFSNEGKLIYNLNNTNPIDVSSLANGIYFIKLFKNNGT